MLKKVFTGISFLVSLLALIALVFLTVSLVQYYHHIRTSPGLSGIDYLGLMIYPVLYCLGAVPGLVSSVIAWRFTTNKAVKIVSAVLLGIFAVVLIVFGAIWLS